ncbi:MAG: hypothetical protein AAF514_13135 [Verrucomicrobiota bacterium]
MPRNGSNNPTPPVHLVFQGGGASLRQAESYAREIGLRNCRWEDNQCAEKFTRSLFAADVLIATQRQSVQGLLWPSKLAIIQHIPRPILWVGATDGAIAQELISRGQAGIFGAGQVEEIASWVLEQSQRVKALPYLRPCEQLKPPEMWKTWVRDATREGLLSETIPAQAVQATR